MRHAIATGLVQGFTEALPISSSAHLGLLRAYTAAPNYDPSIQKALDVAVHVGSLAGPLILLRHRKLGLASLIAAGFASLPAAVVGGSGRGRIERRLGRPQQIALLGAAASTMTWLIDRRAPQDRDLLPQQLSAFDLLLIGSAQAVALAPGVSRSGVTYATARARGLTRSSAADVALVTGIPVIVGASTLIAATHAGQLRAQSATLMPAMAAAAVASIAMTPTIRPALMRGAGLFATYRWGIGALLLRSRQEQRQP